MKYITEKEAIDVLDKTPFPRNKSEHLFVMRFMFKLNELAKKRETKMFRLKIITKKRYNYLINEKISLEQEIKRQEEFRKTLWDIDRELEDIKKVGFKPKEIMIDLKFYEYFGELLNSYQISIENITIKNKTTLAYKGVPFSLEEDFASNIINNWYIRYQQICHCGRNTESENDTCDECVYWGRFPQKDA